MHFEIYLSLYREKEEEVIYKKVWELQKYGQTFAAAARTRLFVKTHLFPQIKNKIPNVKFSFIHEAEGFYEGNSEPSVRIEIDIDETDEQNLRDVLTAWKKKTNQDSILIWSEDKPASKDTAYIMTKLPNKLFNLNSFSKHLKELTNNKIGSYLTYDYSVNEIIIANKSSEDLSDIQFIKLMEKVKLVYNRIKFIKRNVDMDFL